MRLVTLAFAGLLSLAATEAFAFSITADWTGTAKCFDAQSPPFRLSAVPSGTTQLRFVMTDLDAPNFNHGGGTVAFSGQRALSKGAFSYRGPCPPSGSHRYRWTAEAVDATGQSLGRASHTSRFPQ